jgi:hypothetical protein
MTVTAGASGTGNGTVTIAAQATTGPARSGTLTIAGQTVTVNQSPGCSFAISPESQSFNPPGGNGEVTVTAAAGCAWSATSNVPWITITQGGSGTANGVVRFTVAANAGAPRSGTMTIAGRTFTVNQGQTCAFTLAPQSTTVPAGGASRTFDVQTTAGCAWAATSNAPWITITQNSGSGTGNGTVRIDVAANGGAPRSGTVTAGGATFTVNQAGTCAFSIAPQQQPVSASGGSVNVAVSTTGGCAWTAASNAPWITVAQGSSGTGSGTVTLTIASTAGPARNGTATIAGQTFTAQQASGCTFALSPMSRNHGANGGDNNFNVSTNNACAWKASSNVPWITIEQGADTGNGRVEYDVARNTGPARTGTITVGNATFTVNQSGS